MSSETMQFKTELQQILNIIIHSLYSHKEIFLRELISNASDAIDTVRFQSLTNQDLLEGNGDWKIKLVPDKAANTLTVSDNGVGMSRDAVVENLGTIARSGTKAFLEGLKQANTQDRPGLIGQFGVGFYSAFMVADRVTVVTRPAGPAASGTRWESTGEGAFTVETVEKASRGTDVILHLRKEDEEFLDPWKLRQIVKKYSDFVEHPVVVDVEKEDENKEKTVVEETINARKAIWLRPKAEVTKEEYGEFYRHLTHDMGDPAQVIHYSVEGAIEFKALLYIPAHKPWDLQWGDARKGLHLYIQRVFIMDDCETLLPAYLRFVKGVVDSPDLPLNVSRKLLQQSTALAKIKSNLTGKVLNTLDEMRRTEYEQYVGFYKELSPVLKEGVSQDYANRDKIADLLLFESTKTEAGKYTTFAEYQERMPVSQEAIYYLTGETREMLEQSPYLEAFKARDQEVLLLTDPMDEMVVQWMPEYKGKKLQAVDKGGLGEVDADKKQTYQPLLDYLKTLLPDIQEARLSNRLKESAVCLVSDERAMGAHMERLMARMGRGQEVPDSKRVLELNPDHPAVQLVQKLYTENATDKRLETYARLLYDQAVIAEGSKLRDPAAFAQHVNELLVGAV